MEDKFPEPDLIIIHGDINVKNTIFRILKPNLDEE